MVGGAQIHRGAGYGRIGSGRRVSAWVGRKATSAANAANRLPGALATIIEGDEPGFHGIPQTFYPCRSSATLICWKISSLNDGG